MTFSYGPTECAIVSSIKVHVPESPVVTGDIGYAIGSRSWVVDPDDATRLMPIGAVGELLIEGHIVGSGYLNDEQRTQAAFISSPNFLGEDKSQLARCYKTGDLVRLAPDGTTHFIRRKDDQVKVRGHRMELGEIETALRSSLESTVDCAVVLVIDPATDVQHLVVFVCPEEHEKSSVCLQPLPEPLRRKMQQTLPTYMTPSMMVEIDQMPLTVSGKLNRKALSSQATELLESSVPAQSSSTVTWTRRENLLQELWTTLLGIPVHDAHQNFFTMGGDSLKAIQLIHHLREKGLCLTASEIFKGPTIAAMATHLAAIESQESLSVPERFSLFPHGGKVMSELMDSAPESSAIEDVLPCTPLQAGLMASSLHQDGVYVIQTSYKPCRLLDVKALCRAWDQTIDQLPILRTRIFNTLSGFVQVIVQREGSICSIYGSSTTEQIQRVRRRPEMALGSSLFQVSVITNGHEVAEMLVTAHHAICDAWVLKQVMARLASNYQERTAVEYIPFSAFVQHLQMSDQQSSKDYWKGRLEDATAPSYPEHRSSVLYQPRTTAVRAIQMPARPHRRARVTKATLAEAAWALLLQRYSGTDDVTFGLTVSGRTTDLPSIESVNGPTLATIPSRVQLPSASDSVDAFLYQIQNNTIDALPHAHLGVQNISRLSPDAANACAFRSLLVVQADPELPESVDELFSIVPGSTQISLDYPLVLEVILSARQPELRASFDDSILSSMQVDRLLRQMDHLLSQLEAATTESHVGDLDFMCPSDLAQVRAWNQDVAPPTEDCIHKRFSEQACLNPEKEAICSWDGRLTFKQLEEKSSQLANILLRQGIQGGVLVRFFPRPHIRHTRDQTDDDIGALMLRKKHVGDCRHVGCDENRRSFCFSRPQPPRRPIVVHHPTDGGPLGLGKCINHRPSEWTSRASNHNRRPLV
jgi:non-ribosomal peptide synthetase component F/aryl carrier-like protein